MMRDAAGELIDEVDVLQGSSAEMVRGYPCCCPPSEKGLPGGLEGQPTET